MGLAGTLVGALTGGLVGFFVGGFVGVGVGLGPAGTPVTRFVQVERAGFTLRGDSRAIVGRRNRRCPQARQQRTRPLPIYSGNSAGRQG